MQERVVRYKSPPRRTRQDLGLEQELEAEEDYASTGTVEHQFNSVSEELNWVVEKGGVNPELLGPDFCHILPQFRPVGSEEDFSEEESDEEEEQMTQRHEA